MDIINGNRLHLKSANRMLEIEKNTLKKNSELLEKFGGEIKDKEQLNKLKKNDKKAYKEYTSLVNFRKEIQDNIANLEADIIISESNTDFTDKVIKEFKRANPKLYDSWDNFNPTGKKEVDVHIYSQDEKIKMIDEHGFFTGQTTTEGVTWMGGNLPIKVRLYKGGSILSVTSDLIHGLGHIQDGKRPYDENEAIQYEKDNYNYTKQQLKK